MNTKRIYKRANDIYRSLYSNEKMYNGEIKLYSDCFMVTLIEEKTLGWEFNESVQIELSKKHYEMTDGEWNNYILPLIGKKEFDDKLKIEAESTRINEIRNKQSEIDKMLNGNNDFSQSKIGDIAWSLEKGMCIIFEIRESEILATHNGDKSCGFKVFQKDGRLVKNDLFPMFYKKEIKHIEFN